MRLLKMAVLLPLALFALAAAASAAEPYKLRIGWVVAGADLATLMFAKPGLAVHAGKSYVPELIHFQGTATDVTALAYSTFALGIVNAGMDDLRIIGDEFQDGVPGYHTNGYFVRNDSGIK